jgi:hypothetical protein
MTRFFQGSLGLLLLVATAVAEPSPAAPAVRLTMPGPGAQNLMLGTWTIRVRHEPSPEQPKGAQGVGTEVWRPGPGGRSVIEEYDERTATGSLEGIGIAWWDEKEKGLRVVWCDSQDPGACRQYQNVARWQGNSLVQTEESEVDGKPLVIRETFTDITSSSFTQILEASPKVDALKPIITIHATRASPAAPAKP